MSSRRFNVVVIAIVTVALIGLRLALPNIVKDYLNGQLSDMGDYQGHISDVDIALWRGAYALHGVEVTNVSEVVPVSFFETDIIDLAISWRALLHGAVVAEVDFINPELHFVDGDEGESQSGAGTDWRAALQQLVSIRIDRLDIHNGTLHFHNFQSDPNVHLVLTEMASHFSNLSNTDRSENAVQADFQLEALALESARVTLDGHLDPLGDFRDFDISMKIIGIELQHINELTEAYAKFSFESGTGDFIMELEATDGELVGYAKPLLDNVAIFDLEKDLEDGVFSAAWEALVAGLGRIFRNQPKDRIASQIEIRGNLDQQDISTWQAFISILRNAFGEAYEARFGRE